MVMSLSVINLILLLVNCVYHTTAVPAGDIYNPHRNVAQFGNMIYYTLNVYPWEYNNYGCYCGLGGSGNPVDATDNCCKLHDDCYGVIMDNRPSFLWCSPYLTIYGWDMDPRTNLPYCTNQVDSCKYRVCECDRIATTCFKNNRNTYNTYATCKK